MTAASILSSDWSAGSEYWALIGQCSGGAVTAASILSSDWSAGSQYWALIGGVTAASSRAGTGSVCGGRGSSGRGVAARQVQGSEAENIYS